MHRIALMQGDGIGPEITDAAMEIETALQNGMSVTDASDKINILIKLCLQARGWTN